MTRIQLSDAVTLFHQDCRDAIKSLPDCSVDSCCTDPPYALVSVVKRFGGENAAPAQHGTDGAFARASRGFMGKTWDTGETAFSTEFWAEVYRVLKPGAFVAAFGASRGYHRMACAIEDAGFEIRDSLMYIYGTGFPKSHNLDNKRGDLICGCETEPTSECDMRCLPDPDVSPQIPTRQTGGQVLQPSLSESSPPVDGSGSSTGGIQAPFRTDEPELEGRSLPSGTQGQLRVDKVCSLSTGSVADGSGGRVCHGTSPSHVPPLPVSSDPNGVCAPSRPRPEEQRADESGIVAGQSIAQDGRAWPNCGRCGKPVVTRGLGSALKPAFEPIVLARKPLSEPTVAANVLRWRTGALNIDASRIPTAEGDSNARVYTAKRTAPGATQNATGERHLEGVEYEGASKDGRWPANVVTDGSAEVVAMFPSSKGGGDIHKRSSPKTKGVYGDFTGDDDRWSGYADGNGSAARFFYSAKASKVDRAGSKHPTVKPISLMEWLATLITPPGGTILDPFAGSGTTGIAATNRGFRVIMCEREAEYVADIRSRFGTPRAPIRDYAALAALQARLNERVS
jgi:DNA modification methylase